MKHLNILVVGWAGFVGPCLVRELRKSSHVKGLDAHWYFSENWFNDTETPHKTFYHDIRRISELTHSELSDLFSDIDALVLLAAVSNDPMGNEFSKLTLDVNFSASKSLVDTAQMFGVDRIIFASSCSVYGSQPGLMREDGPTAPLTEYARTKVMMEDYLLGNSKTNATILRFGTAFGFSPGLRVDLAINEFAWTAVKEKKITLKSSGTSFRPFVSVVDMAKVIVQALTLDQVQTQIINVGSYALNMTVLDAAKRVSEISSHILDEEINFLSSEKSPKDTRSYSADFSKFNEIFNEFRFVSFEDTVNELLKNIICRDWSEAPLVRLEKLRSSDV